MSFEFNLPNFQVETASERRMYSYLYQTVQQLNWAMKHIQTAENSGSGYIPVKQVSSTGTVSDGKTPMETFAELKSLIIKSADIINAYYDTINAKLEGLYVAQSEFGEYVEQTALELEANSKGITQNYTNIQGIQVDVSYLEKDIQGVQTEVSGLQTSVDSTQSDVFGLQTDVDGLHTTVGGVQTEVSGVKTEVGSLQVTVTGVQDNVGNLETSLDNAHGSIQGIQGNMSTVQSDVTGLQDSVSSLEGTVSGVQGDVSSLEGTVSGVQKDVTNLNGNVTGLSDKVSGVQADVGSVREEVAGVKDDVDGVKGDIDGLRQDVGNLNTIIVETSAYIKTGAIDTDAYGIPIYGLEIGQTNEVNGEEIFNKYARFSSSRLSFYDQNDTEVAYISDYKLYITNVHITGTLTIGDYEIDTSDGLAFRWVGGKT